MAKFLVHLVQDNGHDVVDKITSAYPNGRHYKINDEWYGVKSDKLTDDLAGELGFVLPEDSPEKPAVGLVIREEAISGFYSKSFWEWYKHD